MISQRIKQLVNYGTEKLIISEKEKIEVKNHLQDAD